MKSERKRMSKEKKKMLSRVRAKQRKGGAGKCLNKRAYGFAEAKLYAASLGQQAYKCPICGNWHLTSAATDIRSN
jgi:hypothetical protein